MKRVLLTIAYDGTGLSGFQEQKGTPETVEGYVNRALASLTGEDIHIVGGSRTDAGVHALCNVAVFDTESRIPAEKFPYALNVRLPEQIRIVGAREVPEGFHPRHTRCSKTYEYVILRAPFPIPVKRLYSTYTYTLLDPVRMDEAAQHLVGEHDFKSFCSVYSQALSTVRTITEIRVSCRDPLTGEGIPGGDPRVMDRSEAAEIVIRVTGSGFLYNMVRIIAGTLMEAGRGAIAPEDVRRILEARDRRAAGPTAPAEGLTLTEYRFMEEER